MILVDDSFHVYQLRESWGGGIVALPVGVWRKPDGKGFGKIVIGMSLGVPPGKMVDEMRVARDGVILGWVGL